MQRYLCIFGLSGTNKVISVEVALRQSMQSPEKRFSIQYGRHPAFSRSASAGPYSVVDGNGGDPGAIRTRDPQIRNLMLYPAELRGLPAMRRNVCVTALRRATYVRSAGAAIARNPPAAHHPLHYAATTPKYVSILSKVDLGCMGEAPARLDCITRAARRARAHSVRREVN